jgi:hypothetical protein
MADQPDRPDQPGGFTPPAADPAAQDDKPPAAKAAKAAKKAQPKKAPARAVKKAAAKKAPPKKAPPKPDTPPPPIAADRLAAPQPAPPDPKPAPQPDPEPQPQPVAANLADTNGEAQRTASANEAAAQAKWSVQSAPDSLTGPAPLSSSTAVARLCAVVALAVALLAILMIRRLRASTD